MILVPLRGEGGQIFRVLGGLAAEGEIGRAPRRFRLVSASVATCGTPRPLAPLRLPVAPEPAPASATGFADAAPKFGQSTDAPPRVSRGHLTLVHSSD
jgi:hypothetical protein